MKYEYDHFIAVFDKDSTLVQVNRMAAAGWRFMFTLGNVYWFERPVPGDVKSGRSHEAAVEKQRAERERGAGIKKAAPKKAAKK